MADKMRAKKEAEADAKMKEGDKYASSGIFKKADWNSAAGAYETAGNSYKNAKSTEKAIQAFTKAAQAYMKDKLPNSAAKNYEAAASCTNGEAAVELLLSSANSLKEGGLGERAGQVLAKAAKLLETDAPARASDLYKEAVDLYEIENKEHMASELFRNVTSFYIRTQMWTELLDMWTRVMKQLQKDQLFVELYRVYLSIIIVHLFRNDYVAADRAYSQYAGTEGFVVSDEAVLANTLLNAYQLNSPEDLKKAQSNILITFLDHEIAKLAKKLTIAESDKDSLL
eukprot:TRINITY_DN15029_c0_g1_i1.p1 TRINITY_DN15029_c0_g1~~TRINITY_DN15029_c0_g1_i1.p1  ORF type:complete len:284 (+),score=120.42 TRINITY_DN15029_c0_g1_i1:39-890(+)